MILVLLQDIRALDPGGDRTWLDAWAELGCANFDCLIYEVVGKCFFSSFFPHDPFSVF